MAPDDPRHGTTNGYKNLECRCARCRTAWADYTRQLRAERKLPPPDSGMHGRYTTYQNYGCRCAQCRQAAACAWARYWTRAAAS